ncbi:MAG: spore coat protein H [Bacteroidia bacterium]|jgi:spore coat protein H
MKNPLKNFDFRMSILLMVLGLFSACSDDAPTIEDVVDDTALVDTVFEVTDWTTGTHSKSADPNFDEVFEDNTVKRLDIVITSTRWQSMLDDMTSLYGDFWNKRCGWFRRRKPNICSRRSIL